MLLPINVRLVAASLLSASLLGCASIGSQGFGEELARTEKPLEAKGNWALAQDARQAFWLAYYDLEPKLWLKSPDGKERVVGNTFREQAQSGVELAPVGDDMHLLWRDKAPKKGLYAHSIKNGSIKDYAGDSQPLPRIRVVEGQKGHYYLWLGEKVVNRERFNLYMSPVEAAIADEQKLEPVLPGLYPVYLADDGVIGLFTTRVVKDGKLQVAVRVFDEASQKWGDVTIIREAPNIGPTFKAFQSGKRWFVFWQGFREDRFVFEGAYSDDKGQKWTALDFPTLSGVDIASISFVGAADGTALLALSGPNRSISDKAKLELRLLRSTDQGASWSELGDIREAGNSGVFHAKSPKISFFGNAPQDVIVLWEEWNSLRAVINAAISHDAGKTWSRPVELTSKDRHSTFTFDNQPLFVDGDKLTVAVEEFTNDAMKEKRIVLKRFSLQEIEAKTQQPKPQVDMAARKALLESRANGYWKAKVDADYSAAYEFLDPFFRANFTKEEYRARMGRVLYHVASVEDLEIDGVTAKAKIRIEASVPPFMSGGKRVSRDRTEINFKEKWLFIDGTWVKEYLEETSETVWTRY